MHSENAFQIKHHHITTLKAEQHHSQTDHILMLINQGQLSMQYQHQVELGENMLTLIPPGKAHELLGGSNLDIWWMSFCPHCLALDLDPTLLKAFDKIRLGALPVFTLNQDRADFLRVIFQELNRVKLNKEAGIENIQKSLITLILHEINKSSSPFIELSEQTDLKVNKALDYIQAHYLKAISLKDVADAIHCSPSHLAFLMKQHTGYTVGQWVIRSRLTQACSRLLHSNQEISQLVYELGWHDVTHFIRQFKKAYGTTPAAWRKQQKKHINPI